MNITIDNEFRTLIYPLTWEEFAGLEALCLKYGIQDSLKTWNGILIDGHNRYEIAQKHGLEFETKEMEFSSRDDVKIWIIDNQLDRRNLDKWQRFDLVKKREKYEMAKAKERQGTRTDLNIPPKLAEGKGDTRDKMASQIGVSHGTYDKMKVIDESDNEEVKQKVRNKEMSIDKAYREVKGLPDKPKKSDPVVEEPVVTASTYEEPLPFDETVDDIPEELAHTFDVFDATHAAEFGNTMETLIELKERGDSLLDEIKKVFGSSDKEAFIKKLKDCERFLAHIEIGLIGW